MPVTFPVANRTAEAYTPPQWGYGKYDKGPSNIPDNVLAGLPTTHHPTRLLQSSVDGTRQVIVKKNGFVLGAVTAYNRHHNLVIRPDDVWIAIISQLNFYINAHAEELRDMFVGHEGKKDLIVTSMASLDQVDFGDLAVQMSGQIHQNVKDKSLIPWVLPNFSTTTANDTVICSALIMSTLKQYFRYIMMLGCGIPSITLDGTQADWQALLSRIDKIPSFGAEPTEWAHMLRAVLLRFVRAFDAAGGPPQADKAFWERMVHEVPGGSQTPFISGWICAFCAWDHEGKFFEAKGSQESFRSGGVPRWVMDLTFDGVWFPRVWKAPEGYAEVDVLVKDVRTGEEWDCAMLAGHVGICMDGEERLDTVRMAPQWFMYVKGEERQAGSSFWT